MQRKRPPEYPHQWGKPHNPPVTPVTWQPYPTRGAFQERAVLQYEKFRPPAGKSPGGYPPVQQILSWLPWNPEKNDVFLLDGANIFYWKNQYSEYPKPANFGGNGWGDGDRNIWEWMRGFISTKREIVIVATKHAYDNYIMKNLQQVLERLDEFRLRSRRVGRYPIFFLKVYTAACKTESDTSCLKRRTVTRESSDARQHLKPGENKTSVCKYKDAGGNVSGESHSRCEYDDILLTRVLEEMRERAIRAGAWIPSGYFDDRRQAYVNSISNDGSVKKPEEVCQLVERDIAAHLKVSVTVIACYAEPLAPECPRYPPGRF